MNGKISVVVICVEVTIYLLLYNLHDCTFDFTYCTLSLNIRRSEATPGI